MCFFSFKCVLTKCILRFYTHVFSTYVNGCYNLSHYILGCCFFLTKYCFSDCPCHHIHTKSFISNQHSLFMVHMISFHPPPQVAPALFPHTHTKLQRTSSGLSLQGPTWGFPRSPSLVTGNLIISLAQ